jgi:hypothetical protein
MIPINNSYLNCLSLYVLSKSIIDISLMFFSMLPYENVSLLDAENYIGTWFRNKNHFEMFIELKYELTIV